MIKVLKVLYNNKTKFILDVVNKYNLIIESFNADKQLKKVRPMQTRFGSTNLPLIIFEDENLNEIDAIWSESSPDWVAAINKKIKQWN
jgi:transcriptional antiterminator